MSDTVTLPSSLVERLASVLERLEASVGSTPIPAKLPAGLLSYEEVGVRLGRGGKPMSRRQVERLAAKHSSVLKKVRMGNRAVGFRQADVDRLIARLAGDEHARRQL